MKLNSNVATGSASRGPAWQLSSILRNRSALVLFGGMALLFIPSFWGLLRHGLWSTDEHSHGPVILAIGLWLLWTRAPAELDNAAARQPAYQLAWLCLLTGMALYVSGIALQIVYFEVGAFIPILVGCLLMLYGKDMVRRLMFPLFFFLFMIPVPGFVLDPVGGFMKGIVSQAAEFALHGLGYPISRTGVLLQIGQYQLLVAEACAGMRTLFLLEAFGILYLNVVRHTSMLRNVALALLIVPVSFIANVIRVVVLALVTYHWGDAAGQGFLHGFSGIVLFVSAFVLIIFIDTALRAVSRRLAHST